MNTQFMNYAPSDYLIVRARLEEKHDYQFLQNGLQNDEIAVAATRQANALEDLTTVVAMFVKIGHDA